MAVGGLPSRQEGTVRKQHLMDVQDFCDGFMGDLMGVQEISKEI